VADDCPDARGSLRMLLILLGHAVADGAGRLDKAAQTVAELEQGLENLPEVELPGAGSLKHALACVELVRRLNQSQGRSAN
jgi:hypothetical protein